MAKNVRRFAVERGMTINALADFSDVSRSHMHAVLACQRAATIDWVAKVAATLKVTPSTLLE